MKRVSLPNYTGFKKSKSLPAINLKWIGPLALQYFKPDEKNKFGVAVILFALYDITDLDNRICYQLRIDPEDESDVQYIQHCPINIANMTPEFRMSLRLGKGDLKPGINLFPTDMIFSKNNGKYQFKGLLFDNSTSTLITQTVNCDTCSYIRLSQFIYWMLSKYPLYMTAFSDYKYNKLKIFKVDYVSYDGSCRITVNKDFDMMIHYTIFANSETLEPMKFGFNLPHKRKEGKIEKMPLTETNYTYLFKNDDTVTSDRIFFVSNPTPAVFILSGERGKDYYYLFMFDMKVIEKYHLLDDEYNIYFQEEKN